MSVGYICACGLQKPEEHVESPRAGITGSCEEPDAGAGYQTLVLCKSNKSLFSLVLFGRRGAEFVFWLVCFLVGWLVWFGFWGGGDFFETGFL